MVYLNGKSTDVMDYIKSNEGCKLTAYKDSEGLWTIGYGHCTFDFPHPSITAEQADFLFQSDFLVTYSKLRHEWPALDTLPEEAWIVCLDLAFNLGIGSERIGKGVMGFVTTRLMLFEGRWQDGAAELLRSHYARELPERANRNAYLLKSIKNA